MLIPFVGADSMISNISWSCSCRTITDTSGSCIVLAISNVSVKVVVADTDTGVIVRRCILPLLVSDGVVVVLLVIMPCRILSFRE